MELYFKNKTNYLTKIAATVTFELDVIYLALFKRLNNAFYNKKCIVVIKVKLKETFMQNTLLNSIFFYTDAKINISKIIKQEPVRVCALSKPVLIKCIAYINFLAHKDYFLSSIRERRAPTISNK